MSDTTFSSTPPELHLIAEEAVDNLLPPKSKGEYEKEYLKFKDWCGAQNLTVISENVLLAFSTIMSKSYKSSTLWKNYSMLRSMLKIRENIDISKFMKLQALLRRTSVGYEAKKSKILEYPEIERFINEAPNTKYLAAKVILIIGYFGACRREELKNLLTDDIDYKSDSIFVTVPKTKTKRPRLFAITNAMWIGLIKEYACLRPVHITHKRFFIFYRQGRCTVQPIGLNKVGEMPRIIARYLKLQNCDEYSGHCFRRSAASHLANNGADIMTLKQHGGWKSSSTAEGYVDQSKKKELKSQSYFRFRLLNPNNLKLDPPRNNNVPGITINAGEHSTVTVKIYNNCSFKNES
ncbi:uncharacterized protein LOC116163272 isoform X2 [Photinus pyralis]|uniref:uncharacterized protein LOC116163272 isoform X2 n=1 Tax=Photinus pyralis TaxID=7054 RepID=UPI001266FFA6|nr:uncharacterized protein LOC116163272 isoform X2 [Photinus pyralis]